MTKNKTTLTWRVAQLEKNYDKLDEKFDLLLSNHLPSIEKEIIALRTRVNIGMGVNVIQVIALIIGIAVLLR